MARKSEKEALIERLEASRQRLGTQVEDIREKFNVPKRLGRSVKGNPLAWFGGSLGVGLVASKLLKRPRKKKKKKGILRFLLPIVFSMLKPWLKTMATNELQRRVSGASRQTDPKLPLSHS